MAGDGAAGGELGEREERLTRRGVSPPAPSPGRGGGGREQRAARDLQPDELYFAAAAGAGCAFHMPFCQLNQVALGEPVEPIG